MIRQRLFYIVTLSVTCSIVFFLYYKYNSCKSVKNEKPSEKVFQNIKGNGMNSFLKSKFEKIYGKNKVSDAFILFCERSVHQEVLRVSGIDMDKNKSKIYLTLRVRELCDIGSQNLPIGLVANMEQVPCQFIWKSEKGYKNVELTTQEIDTSKVSGWIEGLDVQHLLHSFYPKPIKIMDSSKLSYELKVEFFMNDPLYLKIELFQMDLMLCNDIEHTIDVFINSRNKKSERYNGKYGYIHNWFVKDIEGNCMIYEFDFGTRSLSTMRLLLEELNQNKHIKRVTVTSNIH